MIRLYKISVGLNGCGYAACIGVYGSVRDEVQKTNVRVKKQRNHWTKDETSSSTE